VGDDQVQPEKGHNGKEEKEILFFYKRVVIWPAACVTYCIIITGQDATVRVIYGRVIYFHVFECGRSRQLKRLEPLGLA
jgi:hypothetical protein